MTAAGPAAASVAPGVAALLFGCALLLLGNGLQGSLLTLRASLEEFSPLAIGAMGSAYYIGFASGCLYGAYVIRRVGHIRGFAAMVAVASAVTLAHPLAVSPTLWVLFRAMTGFCFSVLYIVIESWLNEKATNRNRGLIFSLYAVISFSMIGAGQFLLTLAPADGYPLFLFASILVSLAAVPVALTEADQPAPVKAARVRVLALYRISPAGLVGCLGSGVATGAFWALAPLMAQGAQHDVTRVALFMGVVVLAGAVGQWPIGLLSDRVDRRLVMSGAALAAAAAGLALALTPEPSLLWLLIQGGVFGFFTFPLYSLAVANVNDFVSPDGFVEAASGSLLVWAGGAAIGPVLGSVAVSALGPHGLFAATALVHAALAGFAYLRSRARAPAPEEKGAFVDAVRVGQTLSQVEVTATAEPRAP